MKKIIFYTTIILFATLQTFAQNTNTYEYDANNRLTKVTYGNGVTVAYSYDALGNRTSKEVSISASNYTITTNATPANAGIVTGGGNYFSGTAVELRAIAYDGFIFSTWSDGVSDNPRSITVTENKTFTAQFDEKTLDTDDSDISEYDNVLYINQIESYPGAKEHVIVRMKNSVDVEGFNFDLYLPDGITVSKDADGQPEISLSTQRTTEDKTNFFESVLLNESSVRVLAASTKGYVIDGNDGNIAIVKVMIDDNISAGIYPIYLRDISISDINARSYDTGEIQSSIIIKDSSVGIREIEERNTDDSFYTIGGIKITSPKMKGIYIHNGKKIVVK